MKTWAGIGFLIQALAVCMGAFGAHGLRSTLSPEMMVIYEKAVFYHFIHGFAVIVTAVLGLVNTQHTRILSRVCLGFALGIILFSGSLYALSITELRWLGAITPLGGTLWIMCWVVLGWRLIR